MQIINPDYPSQTYSFGQRGPIPKWVKEGLNNGTFKDPRICKEVYLGFPYIKDDLVCITKKNCPGEYYVFGQRGKRPNWVNDQIKQLQKKGIIQNSEKWYTTFTGIENVSNYADDYDYTDDDVFENETQENINQDTPPFAIVDRNGKKVIYNPDDHTEFYVIGAPGRKPRWIKEAELNGLVTIPKLHNKEPKENKIDKDQKVIFNPKNPNQKYVIGSRGRKPDWYVKLIQEGRIDEDHIDDNKTVHMEEDGNEFECIEPPTAFQDMYMWRFVGNAHQNASVVRDPLYVSGHTITEAINAINQINKREITMEEFEQNFRPHPGNLTRNLVRAYNINKAAVWKQRNEGWVEVS